MKKLFAVLALAGVLMVGANTIFPPVDAQSAASDPFDPMATGHLVAASDPFDPMTVIIRD